MKVILSFAVESAGCPRIHDLFREAAEFLTAKGLRGNFHLTGDFARALRRGARRDVIRALARHEIGYHGNHHGGRPFMAGYCEQAPWRDAVATWLVEELPGIRILEELFERPPAYYSTEFVVAPQVVCGSWLAGIPGTSLLLGQGAQGQPVALPDGGQGAAWYCNSFVPSGDYRLSIDPQRDGGVEEAQRALAAQAARLAAAPGVLRAFMHAYMLVQDSADAAFSALYREGLHSEDFIHDLWPEPVILRNIEGMKSIFSMIAEYPGARLLGFSDYRAGYYPGHGQWLTLAELDAVAARAAEAVDAVMLERASVSPAEAAGLLARILRIWRETKTWPEQIALRSLIGPVEESQRTMPPGMLGAGSLLDSLPGLDRVLDDDGHLPAGVEIGGRRLGPGQWLQCLARLYGRLRAGEPAAGDIACPADSLPAIASAPFFQQTGFTRRIYPEGFTGARICRLVRLQAWSWKPACRRKPGRNQGQGA